MTNSMDQWTFLVGMPTKEIIDMSLDTSFNNGLIQKKHEGLEYCLKTSVQIKTKQQNFISNFILFNIYYNLFLIDQSNKSNWEGIEMHRSCNR